MKAEWRATTQATGFHAKQIQSRRCRYQWLIDRHARIRRVMQTFLSLHASRSATNLSTSGIMLFTSSFVYSPDFP